VIKINFEEKKAFLDYLYYDVCKQAFDFKLCHLGEYPSKWKKYSEVCFDYTLPENKRFIDKYFHMRLFLILKIKKI